MRRGWYWPLIIIGLLVSGIAANLTMLMLASGDPAFSVEPDYYAKAVKWDEHMAQERRNAELGWVVELVPSPAELTVRLTDREAHPVVGARMTVEAFPVARGNRIVSTDLAEDAEHRYAAAVALNRPGLWEFRLIARRGADTFTAVSVHNVSGNAP